jgi:hypothetical protein
LNTFHRLIQGGVIAGFLLSAGGCLIVPPEHEQGREHEHERDRDRDRDHDREHHCDEHDDRCRDR